MYSFYDKVTTVILDANTGHYYCYRTLVDIRRSYV